MGLFHAGPQGPAFLFVHWVRASLIVWLIDY
jgi:hypothetical protein